MRFTNFSDYKWCVRIVASLLLSTLVSSAESLEDKSPFLPPGHNKPKVAAPPPVVASNGPLSREIEFRGVVQMDDAYQISLFNKSNQKGYWIKVGEQKEGVQVTAFDLDAMAVTLNKDGRSERLTLLESNDSPLPVAVSAQKPQTNQNTNRPGIQNTTNNSSNTKRTIPRRRVILPRK